MIAATEDAMRRFCVCSTLLLLCSSAGALVAQRPATPAKTATPARAATAPARSAPISNIRYDVGFDSATAARRTVQVAMSFDVGAGAAPVLLSIPAWTPGAYEISNFARWISGFSATVGDRTLFWDKADPDTWRIRPAGAGRI
ncbi:MAG TPA: hypothetical protein VIE46_12890, partial [Gemmatimonadales bacterium]